MNNYSICLREFEERDIDFILTCKNDKALNEMIVGTSLRYTYEDAKRWVQGCMGEHDNFKFWAVCTNDKEKKIVGWVSLSNIDKQSRSVCHHGIVIGDKFYRDGTAMFEAMLLSMEYAFNILHTHRLYCSCLSEHKTTPHMLNALGFVYEGSRRDAIYKNGKYYNILDYSLLEDEFQTMVEEGKYELNLLIINFVKSVKK